MYPEAIGKHNMSSVSLVKCCSDCDHNAKTAALLGLTKISLKNISKDQGNTTLKCGLYNSIDVRSFPLVSLIPGSVLERSLMRSKPVDGGDLACKVASGKPDSGE